MAEAKRLRKLADFLDTHPDKYNQGAWIRGIANEGERLDDGEALAFILKPKNKNVCGTACCAAGWAVSLNRSAVRKLLKDPVISDELELDYFAENYGKSYLPDTGWETLGREVLGLDRDTASWLFDSMRDEEAMPNMLRMLADGYDLEDLHDYEAAIQNFGAYLTVKS